MIYKKLHKKLKEMVKTKRIELFGGERENLLLKPKLHLNLYMR